MDTMTDDLLILFIKNMVKGRVKSRLAADLGMEMAMAIYERLLKDTLKACETVNAKLLLLFSDHVDSSIGIKNRQFARGVQKGEGLGERMMNAFDDGFGSGFHHICLAGTDCYGISTNILQESFRLLRKDDFVLGPANDGGYYLIGMNFPFEKVFSGKAWSTSEVFDTTMKDIRDNGFSCGLLPQMVDIDTRDDLDQLNIDPKIFLHNDS